MTTIHVDIDTQYMDRIESATGLTSLRVIQEALTLMSWAVKEAESGRLIFSADKDGQDVSKLVMRSLDRVRPS